MEILAIFNSSSAFGMLSLALLKDARSRTQWLFVAKKYLENIRTTLKSSIFNTLCTALVFCLAQTFAVEQKVFNYFYSLVMNYVTLRNE